MSDNHEKPDYDKYPDWLKQMFAQGMNQGNYGVPPVNPSAMGSSPMTPEQCYLQMQALSEQAKVIQQQAAQYQYMMAQQAHINQMQANMQAQMAHENKSNSSDPFENDPIMQKAQAMLDNAMGEEEAGVFKELLGNLNMNDKDFWKGAMVGAAAALILGNENVRKSIMGMVGSTGELFNSGSVAVKETATNTASSVKESVVTGSEVVKDTYQAGKEGFKDSVARHQSVSETNIDSLENVDALENNSGSVNG